MKDFILSKCVLNH